MKTRFFGFLAILPLLGLGLVACEGKKPLDKCDGFFQQGCKAPLQCVNIGDDKKCVDYCDTTFKCKDPKGCCAAPFECRKVDTHVTKNGTDLGSIGTSQYCMPK